MKPICEKCNINCYINKIKDRLEHIIIKENHRLLDENVIKLSQLLDNFIYKCTFCDKHIRNSINDSNFDYLGDNHFLISLYFYIFLGIKHNQMIYLSMNENLYNNLLSILKSNNLPMELIKFKSIKDAILSNTNGGLMGLEEKIKEIASEHHLKKHTGFRWISQPTYGIKNTNISDFFNWELNLSDALKNTNNNSVLEFVYKEYNSINEARYMDEPVIDTNSNVNSYVLDDLIFKGLEYKF